MREFRSCKEDPELYRKVKEAVSISQAAEYCGLKPDGKGWCICPFHQDKHPSMRIFPNGKGFYCFVCGAGGDQITLTAKYYGIRNGEAAKKLAAAFRVPLQEPVTYQEQREADLEQKRKMEFSKFVKRAKLYLRMYWILLCSARRNPKDPHFLEGIHKVEYAEYLLDCMESCPEDMYKNQEAVKQIGEIERRVIGWNS